MRILVIEDSAPTRELLQRSLAGGAFDVILAARAATGLRLASAETFDVIVLDVMLPDGSGIDLCRTLRSRGIQTPVLFLTARGEVEDRVSGLDAGGDDYLRKPFALAELHARLRALGRRQGLAPPARVELGATRIDFTARRCEHDGAEVSLTGREWQVLELLASRPGRLVARDEILDTLWGARDTASSESLDVIMSRLRRKLGELGGECGVRTVRGAGYTFECAP